MLYHGIYIWKIIIFLYALRNIYITHVVCAIVTTDESGGFVYFF